MSTTPKYRHGGPVPEDGDESADETNSIASIRGDVPIVGSLLVGVGAFSLTYILAVLTAFVTRSGASYWYRIESPPHVLTEAAWTVLMNLGAGLYEGGEPVDGVSSLSGVLRFALQPITALVVFGIIVGAGYVVADCVRTDSSVKRIGASLLVVPAYLVFGVVLSILATWTPPESSQGGSPGNAELAISTSEAVIYAGIVVPTILALLGGTLAVGYRVWLANRDPR